jgi:1,4-dihydroxy-2-naphthoate octaprenyltransferase
MTTVRLLSRLFRPFFLFGVAVLYALGAGIARYLGTQLDWGVYLIGQAWVTLLQIGCQLLYEYFTTIPQVGDPTQFVLTLPGESARPGKIHRVAALWWSYACLTVVASLSVLFIRFIHTTPGLFLVMGLMFLAAVLYSVPPVRLAFSGYGELTLAVLVTNLVPAFAFQLQTDLPLRLVAMSTFPLTALFLAMMLVFELNSFAGDLKYDRRTLMLRIGWQNGILAHNLLILTGYLFLALAVTFGLPWRIGLPGLLTLPLGLLQVWAVNRVAAGAKPQWRSLTMTAITLLGLLVYFLLFLYWVS